MSGAYANLKRRREKAIAALDVAIEGDRTGNLDCRAVRTGGAADAHGRDHGAVNAANFAIAVSIKRTRKLAAGSGVTLVSASRRAHDRDPNPCGTCCALINWAFDLDALRLRFAGNAADFLRNHGDPPCRGVNRRVGLAPWQSISAMAVTPSGV
jgi:hypothetical protein